MRKLWTVAKLFSQQVEGQVNICCTCWQNQKAKVAMGRLVWEQVAPSS